MSPKYLPIISHFPNLTHAELQYYHSNCLLVIIKYAVTQKIAGCCEIPHLQKTSVLLGSVEVGERIRALGACSADPALRHSSAETVMGWICCHHKLTPCCLLPWRATCSKDHSSAVNPTYLSFVKGLLSVRPCTGP